MSELAIMLLMSGFQCPNFDAWGCAEVFVGDEYVLTCYDGEAVPPVTLPCDKPVRIEIDPDELTLVASE